MSPCLVFYFPVRTASQIKDDYEGIAKQICPALRCYGSVPTVRMDDSLLSLVGITCRSDKLRRGFLVLTDSQSLCLTGIPILM